MHVSKLFKRHCFDKNNLLLRNISMPVSVIYVSVSVPQKTPSLI